MQSYDINVVVREREGITERQSYQQKDNEREVNLSSKTSPGFQTRRVQKDEKTDRGREGKRELRQIDFYLFVSLCVRPPYHYRGNQCGLADQILWWKSIISSHVFLFISLRISSLIYRHVLPMLTAHPSIYISLAVSLSHTHSLSHRHTLSLPSSLFLPLFTSLHLSLSHTHTHSHTDTLSPCLPLFFYLSSLPTLFCASRLGMMHAPYRATSVGGSIFNGLTLIK